jgi:ATP-dependent RNA helicase SUPV3L1/SUV3
VLRGLAFEPTVGASPEALRAVRRLAEPLVAERLDAIEHAADDALHVDGDGGVRWGEDRVGYLVAGDDWRRPHVRARRFELLDGAQRGRLTTRLQRWLTHWLAALSTPPDVATPLGRGIAFAAAAALGAVPRSEVAAQLARAKPADRAALAAADVLVGRRAVLIPRLVEQVQARRALWQVAHGGAPTLPADGGRAPFRATWPGEVARALLFARLGPWVVRIDALEALLAGGDVVARDLGLSPSDADDLRRHVSGSPVGRRRG